MKPSLAAGRPDHCQRLYAGVANDSLVIQAGLDVVIDLRGGNTVTVLNAVRAEVLGHMVWSQLISRKGLNLDLRLTLLRLFLLPGGGDL